MNNQFLREFVEDSELLSAKDLEFIDGYVFEKNVDFLDALLENNFLNQEILSEISASIMGVPNINLKNKIIDLETFSVIPELISKKHNLVCFKMENNFAHIAFSDIKSLEILENILPKKIKCKFFLAKENDILEKKADYVELLSEELSFKTENNVNKIFKIKD
jgi:hypothetical protein